MSSKPGMMAHVCNLSTWGDETEGSWVQGQPELHTDSVSQNTKDVA
jgi:hypothetical protein